LIQRNFSFFDLSEYSLIDLPEGKFDLLELRGAGLDKGDAIFLGHLLAFGLSDVSFIFEIAFVADQNDLDAAVAVGFDFFEPGFDVVEGLPASY
jgi:hypothetical protein